MEVKRKNQKLFIVVGVLLLFSGISLAYFISSSILGGSGGSTNVTTAVINGANIKVEGLLEFNDLDILPGHKNVSSIKVTATGNNELIPYNLIWKGTNTLTTPLNFTIYKVSEQVSVTSTCEKKKEIISGAQVLYEECNISNLEKLGNEISTGTINKNEEKVNLAKDEFITASPTSEVVYYYIVLEYPNLDKPQNEDINGSFDGIVTVEESSIKPDINIIAAYVIQDNGEYTEVEDIPQSGYTINTEKSTCSNGASVRWDYNNKELITSGLTKSGTSCYLYFDKYIPPVPASTIMSNIASTAKDSPTTFTGVATTDEGVYKVADGMYGGYSYYWRGAATTNHVIFANKCWRIVRINGDGSIRLIYNGPISENGTCTGNGKNTAAVIMGSTKAEKYYATSDGEYNNSSYVGWTYTLSSQRPNSNATGTASNAKIQTEAWFNNGNFTEAQKAQVVEGKFCNERTTDAAPSSWSSGYVATWSATGTKFAYKAAKRLYQDAQPTLNCTASDVYTLKVGAITADEAMFAGGFLNTGNTSYYLYTGQYYWTTSPSHWLGAQALVFVVRYDGNLDDAGVNHDSAGLRPVINLKSDVMFNSGSDGTQSNPYVVE